MKRLMLLSCLLSVNTFAVTHISLTRGNSTTVHPGQEAVVVSCLGSVASGPCEVKVDSSNLKLFYLMQGGIRISRNYLEEGIKRLLADYKDLGVCP